MKKAFLILFTFLSISTLHANHLLGGSITWKVLPGGTYEFTLVLYRDCTGNNYNQNIQTILTNAPIGNGSFLCYRTAINYLNRDCANTDCNTVASNYQGAIEEPVFVSNPVVITGSPPPSGWHFRWEACCRPGYLTNLINANNTGVGIYSVMFPFHSHNGPIPYENGFNSSPEFLSNSNFSVCTGTNTAVYYTGIDCDADSIHYQWSQAKNDGGAFPYPNVAYAAGYTFTQPFGASNSATLDAITGKAMLNISTIGAYVTAVQVQEWRCGQLIALYNRDIPVFSKPCTAPSGICGGVANNAPAVTFTYPTGGDTLTPVYDANNSLRYYEMTVAPNANVNITFQATDTDLQPNCSAQTMSFKGESPFLYRAPGYDSLCGIGGDCAGIISNNPGGAFTAALTNTVTFNWSAACNPGGNVPQWCSGGNEIYPFYFEFTDNACYYPKTNAFLVYIRIGNTGAKPEIVSSDSILCPSDSATLSTLANHTTYFWSTGDTTPTIQAVPGTYWLRVGDVNTCYTVDTFTLPPFLPYTTEPELCKVTYDYYSGRNQVIWERDSKVRVNRYLIYREEAGVITQIGSKSVNALSVFTDSTSVYNVPYSYYLGILDSCGEVYQATEKKHTNMTLTGQRINSNLHLNWNHYTGRMVHKYYIYRAFGLLGQFQLLDSTTANYPAFVDVLQPVSGLVRYQIAALFDTTCTPTGKNADYMAFSNVWAYSWFDLETYTLADFKLFPNPNNGHFEILGPEEIPFTIYSGTGQAVFSGITGEQPIDFTDFPDGLYILVLETKTNPIAMRFIKSK